MMYYRKGISLIRIRITNNHQILTSIYRVWGSSQGNGEEHMVFTIQVNFPAGVQFKVSSYLNMSLSCLGWYTQHDTQITSCSCVGLWPFFNPAFFLFLLFLFLCVYMCMWVWENKRGKERQLSMYAGRPWWDVRHLIISPASGLAS